ncbi:related to xylan 1,4-beta-xylosidase [Rhynchosporium agropyri]|uniref:xylan 1,4-beta-xylosidase n=1 Tax=Rhynchosporium agropyri TaxID=914238 RepID=A0A1E1L170_9HELO|nr:related to xylan 1,4-beta-xylosidase [Rhynchosporium agropyri]
MQLSYTFGLLCLTPQLIAALDFPDCVNGLLKTNKVCDHQASSRERVAALVAALTLEEKLGNIDTPSDGAPRIGLPPYNLWSEALHGVAISPSVVFSTNTSFTPASSFPMPLLMASAFDDDLIEKIATAIGIEARAFANNKHDGISFFTPNVNLYRDPRWGRGSETPGEDVLRVKNYAAAFIRGFEGNQKEKRVIATCKHYAGNDLEAWGNVNRHDFDAKITPQDLAEYYLQPFQTCARDSKVTSFMCAYNAVNGVPSCANKYLMQTILREHWKWSEPHQYIVSDFQAVVDIWQNHSYAVTNAEGTALASNAGMDINCHYFTANTTGAWQIGKLNETTVDRSLQRMYEALIKVGYFDGANAEHASLGWSDVNTPETQKLVLQSTVDGIVMLKNDGTLPLSLAKGGSVAMVGFWANASDQLQGAYSGVAPYLRTPVDAAIAMGLKAFNTSGPILQGTNETDTWTADALDAASKAEYILYFGGLDRSAAEEGTDRTSLEWPSAQLALIAKLAALGKPMVVVQLGHPADNTPLLENKGVNAILWASWPGQEGGTAVMEIIRGLKSPAGRMPVTHYPANYTALPMTDMNLRPSASSPGRTYRWYANAIQPFGFGLHYTTFKASFSTKDIKLDIQELLKESQHKGVQNPDTYALQPLSITVTNNGNRTSDFVTLVFVTSEAGPKPHPLKTLASYGRLRDIAPKKTATIKLQWTLGSLARHDEQGNTVLYPGNYTLLLDEPTQAVTHLTLTGHEAILDKWPQDPRSQK